MPKGKPGPHAEILAYALSHLESERDKIQAKIEAIRQELSSGVASAATEPAPAKTSVQKSAKKAAAEPATKRVMSEAARKSIAAAQKRRWAEHHKKQKAG